MEIQPFPNDQNNFSRKEQTTLEGLQCETYSYNEITMWYWHKDGHENKWNEIKYRAQNRQTYIYIWAVDIENVSKVIHWKKILWENDKPFQEKCQNY